MYVCLSLQVSEFCLLRGLYANSMTESLLCILAGPTNPAIAVGSCIKYPEWDEREQSCAAMLHNFNPSNPYSCRRRQMQDEGVLEIE
jgi:hypothetical protein